MGLDGTLRQWRVGAGEDTGAWQETGFRKAPPSRDLTHFWRTASLAAAGIIALVTVVAIGAIAAGDPRAGTVMGEGWTTSRAGSYTVVPELAGRADFSIEAARDADGRITAGGVTFDVDGGAFTFASTSVDSMSLSPNTVKMTGLGTVGGGGDYGFVLVARAGDSAAGLRLQVWERATGTVVYDNQPVVPRGHRNGRLAAIAGGSIDVQESAAPAASSSPTAGRATRPVVRWR